MIVPSQCYVFYHSPPGYTSTGAVQNADVAMNSYILTIYILISIRVLKNLEFKKGSRDRHKK